MAADVEVEAWESVVVVAFLLWAAEGSGESAMAGCSCRGKFYKNESKPASRLQKRKGRSGQVHAGSRATSSFLASVADRQLMLTSTTGGISSHYPLACPIVGGDRTPCESAFRDSRGR